MADNKPLQPIAAKTRLRLNGGVSARPMKHLPILLLVAATEVLGADVDPVCAAHKGERFTAGEIEALKRRDAGYNALVKEALAQRARDFENSNARRWPEKGKEILLDWAQAKRMVRNGLVVELLESDAGSTHLLSRSGLWYLTKATDAEDIYRIALEVDPCGLQIKVTLQ